LTVCKSCIWNAERWFIYQTVQYFFWSKTWCLTFCHS